MVAVKICLALICFFGSRIVYILYGDIRGEQLKKEGGEGGGSRYKISVLEIVYKRYVTHMGPH